MTDVQDAVSISSCGLLQGGVQDTTEVCDRLHPGTIATIAELRADLEAARRQHKADIDTIGAALIYAANNRDERGYDINGENGRWCGEYDQVIAGLNRQLHVPLPVRSQDYTVRVMVELSISVTATDRDEAQETAEMVVRRAERMLDSMEDVTSHPQDDYEIEED